MAGSLFQTIQVIVGAVVPGGREGEHALEMAPFCSFSLEEQSADPKPWGTDEEQGNQCRQSGQCRADDAAWKVCPSLFLLSGLGEGRRQLWERLPSCPVSWEEQRAAGLW